MYSALNWKYPSARDTYYPKRYPVVVFIRSFIGTIGGISRNVTALNRSLRQLACKSGSGNGACLCLSVKIAH